MPHDRAKPEELSRLASMLEDAGLLEVYTDQKGREAYRLTEDGVRVGAATRRQAARELEPQCLPSLSLAAHRSHSPREPLGGDPGGQSRPMAALAVARSIFVPTGRPKTF